MVSRRFDKLEDAPLRNPSFGCFLIGPIPEIAIKCRTYGSGSTQEDYIGKFYVCNY